MGGELIVKVPYALGWDLVDEGFEQAEQLRGLDWLSQGAVIAVTLVGATADLTTLILARESVTRFVRRVAAWATGQAKNSDLYQLTLRLDITDPGDTGSERHIEVQLSRSDGFSDSDVSNVAAFIATAFDHGQGG